MTANTEVAILDRIIELDSNGLSPELARHILTLDFKPYDHERMNMLSAKAQDGILTQDEEEELDNYLHLSHFLAIIHSKVRRQVQPLVS